MSDRELLELAAKAVGYTFDGTVLRNPNSDFEYDGWNPLTDDGDALRLAVKLGLHVSVFADAIGIGTPERGYVETKWTSDPYAATRRAIVRAATEIGRQMK